MTNDKPDESMLNEVPEAEILSRRRSFSIVWLVPLVAVIIGGWLVYKAQSEKGPTITITFKTAEGLEAGKTKIKYKDVELGQVSAIKLRDDLSQVVVTAELVKEAEAFLSEDTRFWVVRARVGVSGVSGLGTLFSGAFIALDPGKYGKEARHFTGLEIPPPVTTDVPGRHFFLEAETRGSLEIGSPVYYRKIPVGQVVSYQLADDGQMVVVKVFVNAPYDQFVYQNTRFWNVSGLDLKLDSQGVRVDSESVVSILIGGIAFGIPHFDLPGPPAAEERVFQLLDNIDDAQERIYTVKRKWLLSFNESVRGLAVGAPVEFWGIQIGEVLDVRLDFDAQKQKFAIRVLIESEPERFSEANAAADQTQRKQALESLVQRGLRAQLKTGNLLTGQRFIIFDFFPDAPPAAVVWEEPYPEIPTVSTPMEEISTKFTRILNKIDNLPLEQIGNDLRDTVNGVKQLAESKDIEQALQNLSATLDETRQLVADFRTNVTPGLNATVEETRRLISDLRTTVTPEIDVTLERVQQSLVSAEKMLNADSPLQVKLRMSLDEIGGAARSLRLLVDYLERHPEALIRGKGTPK
ncbi:MAG: MlaD family protein [Desulfobacterales bacterium]|jgi:paraquat-inducible protein B